ncbi:hypothetical protein C8J57DRAFT_1214326 [Mycena rebaudengoi]|nr:hypothetical protein C8J57DRAFT_1214326 [Mycena rebaudengoi]
MYAISSCSLRIFKDDKEIFIMTALRGASGAIFLVALFGAVFDRIRENARGVLNSKFFHLSQKFQRDDQDPMVTGQFREQLQVSDRRSNSDNVISTSVRIGRSMSVLADAIKNRPKDRDKLEERPRTVLHEELS